jgi:four helix bundle protein
MTAVRRFQDLAAWQRCQELAELIFDLTEHGPVSRDFSFRDQIREAADAAAPLIAEGFLRFTTSEFIRYLRMARGELGEVQTDLEKGHARKYFTDEDFTRARTLANRAMGTTTNLLKSKLKQLEAERSTTRRRTRQAP